MHEGLGACMLFVVVHSIERDSEVVEEEIMPYVKEAPEPAPRPRWTLSNAKEQEPDYLNLMIR